MTSTEIKMKALKASVSSLSATRSLSLQFLRFTDATYSRLQRVHACIYGLVCLSSLILEFLRKISTNPENEGVTYVPLSLLKNRSKLENSKQRLITLFPFAKIQYSYCPWNQSLSTTLDWYAERIRTKGCRTTVIPRSSARMSAKKW